MNGKHWKQGNGSYARKKNGKILEGGREGKERTNGAGVEGKQTGEERTRQQNTGKRAKDTNKYMNIHTIKLKMTGP